MQFFCKHAAYTKIITVGRRPLEGVTSDKVEFKSVNFDEIENYAEAFEGAQVSNLSWIECLWLIMSRKNMIN